MKNKRIFRLLSIILILIPIMVMTHIFAGRNSTNSYTISGILVSTILLSVFGIILIHNRIKYEVTEEKLKSVLDSTAEAIYGFDLKGNCTFANMSCIKILGYNIEADLIGKNMHHLIHHSYRDGSVYPIEDCKILKNAFDGGTHYSIEEVFWKSDGTSFDVEYRSTPKILDGKIDGGVVTFTDITEKKMAAEKIKYLSYHDPITGLYNQTFVNEETKRLDVKRNLPFSIIVGDVNGLKLTND
ncbi:MAG: PAS domain S-box protein, partial [Clostridia bacterium]|nr:PAS domain S-box protein [Clostridia bacterium]